ncbi:MAG: two-component sensor histidine kinase [Gemmatimonadales bacterium]|nr:Sensor protein ZraS [bacterium HR33]GIW51021.1 MAG: two-component sensor histidine kinase [Gemmatimonadales bacterium]
MDALKRLRRFAPQTVLGLVIVLGVLSLWQAWDIASHLREEARETSRIYGRIVGSLSDPTPGADTEVLLDLVEEIRNRGVPLVVTDSAGAVTAAANLPFPEGTAHPRLEEYIASLDRVNPPIRIPGVGYIHYGPLPIAGRIKWIGILQLGLLLTAVAVGIWAYRTAVRRDRERLWVAMARESAHQMGTPLMSAAAWIERLADGASDRAEIARRLRQDLDRLERVAQRFERIGRPAAREKVALGVVAEKIAAYFRPRLPRHANPITLTVHAPVSGPSITGDPVLLEWALEALVRNSVDALSGRGGHIEITVAAQGKTASLAVSDDGPGVPAEVLGTLFEPGVTTKTGGWGIGLALVRRIVEDVHGGRLELRNSARGATFVAHLPIGG